MQIILRRSVTAETWEVVAGVSFREPAGPELVIALAVIEHGGEIGFTELSTHLTGDPHSLVAEYLVRLASQREIVAWEGTDQLVLGAAAISSLESGRSLRQFDGVLTVVVAEDPVLPIGLLSIGPAVSGDVKVRDLPQDLEQALVPLPRTIRPTDGLVEPLLMEGHEIRIEPDPIVDVGRLVRTESMPLVVAVSDDGWDARLGGRRFARTDLPALGEVLLSARRQGAPLAVPFPVTEDEVPDGGLWSLTGDFRLDALEVANVGAFEPVEVRELPVIPRDRREASLLAARRAGQRITGPVFADDWPDLRASLLAGIGNGVAETRSELAGTVVGADSDGDHRRPLGYWHLVAPDDWGC